MKTLSEHLSAVAIAEIGVKEIGSSNTGKRVQQYQDSTSLGGTGWYWCAAYICWCVQQAIVLWEKEHGTNVTFNRPTTPLAYGFDEWSLQQDNSTKTRRSHGGEAVGIFSLKTVSHCGIAISKPDKNGFFYSVEGNSSLANARDGGGVVKQRRHISQVRDWITFTV